MREFYSNDAGYATSEWRNHSKWHSQQKFNKIIVPEVPIREVVSGHFDFISIDAEGTSVDILKMLDLDALCCNLVCVEYDEMCADVMAWFAERKFKIIYKSGENLIAKRMTKKDIDEAALEKVRETERLRRQRQLELDEQARLEQAERERIDRERAETESVLLKELGPVETGLND